MHEETVELGGGTQARIQGSVLALRGPGVTRQPILSSDSRFLLLWNGEVFDSLHEMDPLSNDGEQIMHCIEEQIGGHAPVDSVLCSVLGGIEGPYAMIFIDVSVPFVVGDMRTAHTLLP